jgi:hypothetical protein
VETRYGKSQRIWALDHGMASNENIDLLKAGGRRYYIHPTAHYGARTYVDS